jgi:hypothetical protein
VFDLWDAPLGQVGAQLFLPSASAIRNLPPDYGSSRGFRAFGSIVAGKRA